MPCDAELYDQNSVYILMGNKHSYGIREKAPVRPFDQYAQNPNYPNNSMYADYQNYQYSSNNSTATSDLAEPAEQNQKAEQDGSDKSDRSYDDSVVCPICMERKISAAIVPCGHTLCYDGPCHRSLKACHICQGPIQTVIRLYFN